MAHPQSGILDVCTVQTCLQWCFVRSGCLTRFDEPLWSSYYWPVDQGCLAIKPFFLMYIVQHRSKWRNPSGRETGSKINSDLLSTPSAPLNKSWMHLWGALGLGDLGTYRWGWWSLPPSLVPVGWFPQWRYVALGSSNTWGEWALWLGYEHHPSLHQEWTWRTGDEK